MGSFDPVGNSQKRRFTPTRVSSSTLSVLLSRNFSNSQNYSARPQYSPAYHPRLNIKLTLTRVTMLLIGLGLGICLGFIVVPSLDNVDNCDDHYNELPLAREDKLEYTKILNLPSLLRPSTSTSVSTVVELKNNSEMTFRRPRYFSTELGLRKKLLVGVIITKKMDVEVLKGLNQTLAQRADKLIFFVGGNESDEYVIQVKSLGLTSVIHVVDNKTNGNNLERVALKVLKYLGEKFSEQFDYFFTMADKFWVNGRLLVETVLRLSITDNFFMGVQAKEFCSLEHGIIISRRLLKKVSASVDQCFSRIPVVAASNSLGQCIRFILGGYFPCQSEVQGLKYSTTNVHATTEIAYNAITIGPIKSAVDFFGIQTRVLKHRLTFINDKIKMLEKRIEWAAPKLPPESQSISWPIGLPHRFVPRTRFEVLTWNYWNQDAVYAEKNTVAAALHGVTLSENKNLMSSVISYLSHQNVNPEKLRLRNGYKRFDPVRGMEYILDFKDKLNNSIRVEGLRPLSKMEVVPIPFVTESQRVTILVPVRTESVAQIQSFLDRFFDFSVDKKQNTVLIFILLFHKTPSPSSKELKAENVEDIKRLISKYNSKIAKSNVNSVRVGYMVTPLSKVTVNSALQTGVDNVIKRIVGTTALIFVADVNLTLKDDFLNRVRMNTILNWQVFSPIPFLEYNPSVYLRKPKTEARREFDVSKTSGYFESNMLRYISFYAADYMTARKLPSNATVVAENSEEFSSFLNLFVQSSNLTVFRAAEPSLKVPFVFPKGCSSFEDCVRNKWASRSQLASLILQE